MKKILTALTAAVAAILMCVCLTACGNGENSVAGTYKFYAVEESGKLHYVTDEDMEITEDYIVFTLNADGKGEQKMQVSETNTVTVPFEWTLNGTELTVSANGVSSTCTLENEIITIEIMGNKALLKKSA